MTLASRLNPASSAPLGFAWGSWRVARGAEIHRWSPVFFLSGLSPMLQ